MRGFIFMLIKDRKADVMGKEFLLGEMTVSLINTPQEQMDKIFEVMLELEKSVLMQYCIYPFIPCKPYIPIAKKPKRAVMIDDITEVDKLLRKAYDLIKSVDVCKAAFPIGPLEEQQLDGIRFGSEEYLKLVASYSQYFNYIYCAAYDLTTMYGNCRDFTDDLVILLDTLNTSELSQAYKYIAFPDECRFTIDSLLDPLEGDYQLGDSMILQYIPMCKDDSDEWYIAEYFRFDTLQGLLKTDFVRGLMKGHFPRKCEHCGRYFLMTKGYHTRFCDMPSPEDPAMTCRQAAYKKAKSKELSKDDPKYQSYMRCRKRINTAFARGSIGEKEKALLLSTLEDLYFEAQSSPRYSNEEFEQLLSSENLYRLCGLEYHGKGRPKAVRRTNAVKRTQNEQSKPHSCAV